VAVAVAAFLVGTGLAQSLPSNAAQPRALVETTTLTAVGESVRVYTQTIDIDSGSEIGPPQWLPGARPEGRFAIAEHGRHVAVITRANAYIAPALDETYVSVIDGPSNRFDPHGWLISEYGWRHTAACFAHRAGGVESLLVTLSKPVLADAVGQGRIDARALSQHPPAALTDKPASWLLPGVPVDAAPMPNSPLVAVLCDDTGHGPILHVRDVDRGEVVVERRVLFEGTRSLTAVALELNGAFLLTLATGPKSGREMAGDATWVRAVATGTWECIGAPLELSGEALDGAPSMIPAAGETCWIATGNPARGFGYLARVQVEGKAGPVKLAEHSFSGVSRALRVAPAVTGPGVALGIGERVHLWKDGDPESGVISFDAPVNAIAWLHDGILIGEGNRIHRIRTDAAGATERLSEFQTGVVTRIIPIPDSRDVPVPEGGETLEIVPPRVVHFRSESAGRELRAIQINSPRSDSGTWRIEWNRDRMPWLNAYPTSGTIPGWFYMGVDKQHYVRGATDTGWLDLYLEIGGGSAPVGGTLHRIATRIAPDRPSIRRILWALSDAKRDSDLRGATDPYKLRALADLLASPPLHFSHHLATDPVGESLKDYSVAVLESNAVLSGVVTRQAVLDYVSRGGALLYVVQPPGEQDSAMIARWLAPVGITIDLANQASGRFTPAENAAMMRNRQEWTLRDAVSTSVDARWQSLIVSDSGGATGLAVRDYGAGRMAVLASRTPLESGELESVIARRSVTTLFQWLGDAGRDVKDLDADGLPDSIEDANGDGAVNPGETDRMNPDSDGDGVPDGAEDRNRNGMVDEGETDPLNPDTDGDGIFDGADLLPLLGAPKVVGR
jgi:hypothetical protein